MHSKILVKIIDEVLEKEPIVTNSKNTNTGIKRI